MKKKLPNLFLLSTLGLSITLFCSGCVQKPDKGKAEASADLPELSFQSRKIFGEAAHWWAHCPGEITNDGITDLIYIHQNSTGGYLAYLEGRTDHQPWESHIIAETPVNGGSFASGDLECGDMDFDGDTDLLAVKHPGEWADAGAPAEIFWYENPGWEPRFIGQVPDAVKDMSLADFNGDNKLDLAVMTFDENTLSVFLQVEGSEWERVLYKENYDNIHEGMGTGDFDGNGTIDVIANGHLFYNPGKNLNGEWLSENLDVKWNNQTGDWSRNATKTYARDLDKDGISEIFISHSERSGYPLSLYRKKGPQQWEEQVILDSIPACQTLQVFDLDLDGDYDLLAGVNLGRAVNLGYKSFQVLVLLSDNNYTSWEIMELGTEGIYNGQVADYDGDGDLDIFRYPHHEATDFFLLENKIR